MNLPGQPTEKMDKAGENFAKTLLFLQKTIMQDAVLWYKETPNHPIFDLEPFRRYASAWERWVSRQERCMSDLTTLQNEFGSFGTKSTFPL